MNPQVPEKETLRLKHLFQVGIGLGLAVAIVSGLFWLRTGPSSADSQDPEEIAEGLDDAAMDGRMEDALADVQNTPSPEQKSNDLVDIEKASESFAVGLKSMVVCLGLSRSQAPDRLDPSFENLVDVVKADLGEPIMRSEDWVSWNLRVGSEERRLRVETDYSNNDQPRRNLSYFKLDAQGQPALIPLPAEQTKDPSEAFVASLQKDGDVYEEQKGRRAYFENGQEVMITERNGKIDDFEFSSGTKTFRCAGIMSSSPQCKCY